MGITPIEMIESAFENGYSTQNLKDSIEEVLGIYFNNKSNLQTYAFESEMLSAYSFAVRYSNDPVFSSVLTKVLTCYKTAYTCNPEIVVKDIYLSSLETAAEKENVMWSIRSKADDLKLQNDIYDKVISYMEYIGNNLEIATKHLISELYLLILLQKNKKIDYSRIMTYDFGVVINNILDQKLFEDLLLTSPIQIKLSDWRNIAYHHKYKIQQLDTIKCEYGKQGKSFEVTMNELEAYTYQIMRSSNVLNIAKCLFMYDNIESIAKYKDLNKEINFRQPLLNKGFETSLMSQGFKLVDIEINANNATAILNDIHNDGNISAEFFKERFIHSSQFLFRLWQISQSKIIKVIYRTTYGKATAESKIAGQFCEEYTDDISILVNHTEYFIMISLKPENLFYFLKTSGERSKKHCA